MPPIISNLLDNDLYKFTMQYAVLLKYPHACVKYELTIRDEFTFTTAMFAELKAQIKHMEKLTASKDELKKFATQCPYLPAWYFDFLTAYRFDSSELNLKLNNDGRLELAIEGYWYKTILWETPLLSLISEIYYRFSNQNESAKINKIAIFNTTQKARAIEKLGVKFADFGQRRRYSLATHDLIIQTLIKEAPQTFVGTSNVHLALKYNLKPIGTKGHEFTMFHGAIYGAQNANAHALGAWVDVYHGDLGIALPDTYTTNIFLKDFSLFYAKLFDGVRHDSGDPLVFAEKIINHYQNLNINPLTKTIVFSDAISSVETIQKIKDFCQNKINFSLGIGTWLTNDIDNYQPLNMVIKMIGALKNKSHHKTQKFIPTVKLSDVEGKHNGDKEMIKLVKRIIDFC